MDVFDQSNLLLNAAKKISLESYLQSRGLFPVKKAFGKLWYFSPFKEEKTPSFCLYENANKFVDYSTGIRGDIIDFICEHDGTSFQEALDSVFKGKLLPINSKIKKKKKDFFQFKGFDWKKYKEFDIEEIEKIKSYAESRKITSHYLPTFFYTSDNDELTKNASLGFIHYDEDLDVCGMKFRFIDPKGQQRFSSRGRLCFYVLENIYNNQDIEYLFITESETSSNSLYNILKESLSRSFVILCIGGSSNYPTAIPSKYNSVNNKYVIIDYDGGTKEYSRKINELSKFGKEILLPYEKGEDINYLYINNRKDEIIYHLTKNGIVFD